MIISDWTIPCIRT